MPLTLTSTSNLLAMIRTARILGNSSERCLSISTTATPGNSYETVFPIDSRYGIIQAIDDGVSPPLQIIEIRLKDESLIGNLKKKLNKKKANMDAEFSREQQEFINDFMLRLTSFYQFFSEIIKTLPFKKMIIFTPTVEHAQAMYTTLTSSQRQKDFMVGLIHAKDISKKKNDKVAQEFREAERGCLINCKKVGEGSDFPEVDIIIELRIFKKSLCAVIQAAGRSLRAKESSALYLWLNLQIGQLDPIQAIFNNSTADRYKFPRTTKPQDITSKLLSPEAFPETIATTAEQSSLSQKPVDCQAFSIITPGGFEVSYNAAGRRVITTSMAAPSDTIGERHMRAVDAKLPSPLLFCPDFSTLSNSRCSFFASADPLDQAFSSFSSLTDQPDPFMSDAENFSRKRKLDGEDAHTDTAGPDIFPTYPGMLDAGLFGPGKHPKTADAPFSSSSLSFGDPTSLDMDFPDRGDSTSSRASLLESMPDLFGYKT